MSYETQADRARDGALEHIKEAISEIFSIINEDVDGLYGYNDNYKHKLNESLTDLLNIKIRLTP